VPVAGPPGPPRVPGSCRLPRATQVARAGNHPDVAELGGAPLVRPRGEGRRGRQPEGGHEPEDVDESVLQQGHEGDEPLAQRQLDVDRGQAPAEERRAEGRRRHGVDQVVLGLEDPEDRALGHAGRLRDLAGGGHRAAGRDEVTGDVDETGPSLLGRQGGGTGRHGLEHR